MSSLLELRHLKTLLALRDTGSISRAAQWLSLTQSALSHQLKLLEEHYGTALFERKSQPVRFTVAGQRLLTLAEEVLAQVQEAERDVARLASGEAGQLRIAVECHTCFDWLMPAMDAFRLRWPEVEMDIVSGFHADPVGLLHQDKADLAIVSEDDGDDTAMRFFPLFAFEMVALLNHQHRLAQRDWLRAEDFAAETLITYPVPDDMLDVVRQVLRPAGVEPAARRTTELTAAMLQLVASGRGIACLPLWAVTGYLERGYVTSKPVGEQGLTGRLWASVRQADARRPYLLDFVHVMREQSFAHLPGIALM
ncbi:LysR family transcriptional regulator [Corticibacter populi]|uniref:HTH-type transcriptional regulator MetR n=1 Tax=Corticibacter populi TaxID=1550736 RepID=A0A3M6QXU1_9BURK|nr:LysR family transcriptional regulator [Corticibacter populi]RMX07846.1 LysR family transcriptional regulator [Corticibacter populi]RZS35079.1 LysR family transcriptional regulator for metE and metH [Corticibacter populi]